MKRETTMRFLGLGIMAFSGVAAAQVTPCPAPAPFQGWARPATLVAGAMREKGRLPMIAVGRAVTLTLTPAAQVRIEMPAKKSGGPVSYAGLVAVSVVLPGTYRIGIDTPAWIELGMSGRPIDSNAHSHGEACSPVRKMVDYALTPGTYTVQIGAAPSPVTTVMVARLP